METSQIREGGGVAYVIFLYQMKQPTVSPGSHHFLHHFYPETEQSGWQAGDTVHESQKNVENLNTKLYYNN